MMMPMGGFGGGGGCGGCPKRRSSSRKRTSTKSIRRKIYKRIGGYTGLKKYPWKKYGRMFVERGTEANINNFGASWKTASADQQARRTEHGYYGAGAYRGGVKLRNLSKYLGVRNVGRQVLQQGTDRLISGMGGYGYTGSGSYNDLVNAPAGADTADNLTITLREYITDVTVPVTAGAFQNITWSLNPGIQSVFPWLSQIAGNYDEYEFKQLVFEYKPTIDASTVGNGQTGTIMLVTQYNPGQQAFTDKEAILQTFGSQSAKLTEPAIHGVECDPAKMNDKQLYVRGGPVAVGEDIKTYDHGVLNLAILGAPSAFAGQQCGELYVYYTVTLKKKRFYVARGMAIQRDIFQNTNPTSANDPWQYANYANMYKGQQNNIGVIIAGRAWPKSMTGLSADIPDVNGTPTHVIFPNQLTGYFKVKFMVEGNSNLTGSMFSSGLATIYGNIKQLKSCICSIGATSDYTDGPNFFYASGNANHVYYEAEFYVTQATLGQVNYFTLPYGIATGTTLQAYAEVHEMNPTFLRSTTNVNACSAVWQKLIDGSIVVDP